METANAHGPMTAHDKFLSADYQAVEFSCKLAEGNRVSCNSLILAKHTEDSAAHEPTLTTPYVGRGVNVWMRHMYTPPWVLPDTPEREMNRQAHMIAESAGKSTRVSNLGCTTVQLSARALTIL